MDKIDEILERLKGEQPVISDPDALTDRIMERLPDMEEVARQPNVRRVGMWQWLSVAASVLLIIGVGTTLFFYADSPQPEQAQLLPKPGTTVTKHPEHDSQALGKVLPSTGKESPRHLYTTKAVNKPSPSVQHTIESQQPVVEEDPYIHHASYEAIKDTMPYQDPARVDEFIAKMADNYNVRQGELICSMPVDSNMVSTVYVFPDTKEIDVFSRLLQVACWYNNEMPGYFLSFSHQQFFFELKDIRKQLQYRWIAERVAGKILLYGTNAPLGTKESSACYQEYRDELMHINSINHKTKEI